MPFPGNSGQTQTGAITILCAPSSPIYFVLPASLSLRTKKAAQSSSPKVGGPEKDLWWRRGYGDKYSNLAPEAVEGAALALERVDLVHGRDRLALGVLRVGDGVPDHVLQENLEHPAGLLVDEPGDALDATAAGQAPDGRLGDALNVVAQHLAVAFSAAFAETLPTFTTARHCEDKF